VHSCDSWSQYLLLSQLLYGHPVHPHRCSIMSYRCSIISYRCSIISYRCSIISYRCSIISYRCSIISYRCSTTLCDFIQCKATEGNKNNSNATSVPSSMMFLTYNSTRPHDSFLVQFLPYCLHLISLHITVLHSVHAGTQS
jgi:hypothetical protein